jgi:chemotaxis protein histidine kinase CheA
MTDKHPIEVFTPPNMLKAKVGSGGLSSSVIKRAEQALEELKEEFAVWIVEDVNRLVQRRDFYQAQSNEEALAELYRASHDLRGQASTFDYPLIARVATSLCNLTDDTNNGLEIPITLINAHVDAMKVIVRDHIKDPTDQIATALAGELERQVSAFLEKQAGLVKFPERLHP